MGCGGLGSEAVGGIGGGFEAGAVGERREQRPSYHKSNQPEPKISNGRKFWFRSHNKCDILLFTLQPRPPSPPTRKSKSPTATTPPALASSSSPAATICSSVHG